MIHTTKTMHISSSSQTRNTLLRGASRLSSFKIHVATVATVLTCLLVLPGRSEAAQAAAVTTGEALTYTTPKGVAYKVTDNGLSEIRLGARVLASGSVNYRPGDAAFDKNLTEEPMPPMVKRVLRIVSPTEARVYHDYGVAAVTYTYTFKGEDVQVKARVENGDPVKTILLARFGGLKFEFGQIPEGMMLNWHGSYTRHEGWNTLYPCGVSDPGARLAGRYAIGKGFGVGATPLRPGLRRSQIFWDWNWGLPDAERAKTTQREFLIYEEGPIQPESSAVFGWIWRVSPETGWKHLLEPYREEIHRSFGKKVRYNAGDNRPLIQSVMNEGATAPGNPYGFHSARRIDTAEGLKRYEHMIIPGMKAANAAGMIMWAQGGLHPRGAMYRPDFDVIPPEIEANLKVLAQDLKAQGLRFGVATRPAEYVSPHNWTIDRTDWINPDSKGDRDQMAQRFVNMTKLGCTLFYNDTFGATAGDWKIMQTVRERIGPDVQTYSEHISDTIAPFSGIYTEIRYDEQSKQYVFPYTSLRVFEICRFLYPEMPIAAMVTADLTRKAPPGMDEPLEFLLRHHITPMIFDGYMEWDDRAAAVRVGKITQKYLDAQGRWKLPVESSPA